MKPADLLAILKILNLEHLIDLIAVGHDTVVPSPTFSFHSGLTFDR